MINSEHALEVRPETQPVTVDLLLRGDPERMVDLTAIMRLVLRHKLLFCAMVLLGILLSILGIFLITAQYRSQSVLIAEKHDESSIPGLSSLATQFGGLASLVGLNSGATDISVESLAVLRSREFTTQFISDLNLLPILYAKKWDAAAKKWNVKDPKDIPTLEDAFLYFDEDIRSISQDTSTNLVTLSIEWNDRQMAADWTNELVKRLNARMRKSAIEDTTRSIDQLQQELAKTSVVELQSGIYQLIEAQIHVRMVAQTEEQYAFRVIDPGVASDEDHYVWPNRPLFLALGLLGGGLLGLGVILGLPWLRELRHSVFRKRRAAR